MSIENLVIVESPAKAKTIEKILGKSYVVKSSYGHIRDLEKKKMGVDVDHDFHPKYVLTEGKEQVIKELKKYSNEASSVWLATDGDREGEAISWHIAEVLKLDPKTTKRIVFHEITSNAIQQAVKNPRLIDMNLVHAQQARRVLDRLVGFKLSPVLIQKVPSATSLSAGRVQSVAVRLIVDKEKEIRQFTSKIFFKTVISLSAIDPTSKREISFKAETKDFTTQQEVEKFLQDCINSDFVVKNVQIKEGTRSPSAPFTTSTMQQEAVRKLGYSVSKVMLVAQKLYEEGYITYMRTDSPNLSQVATDSIEKFVHEQYGKSYHQFRQYKAKNASAQEAHEAIRPTEIGRESVPDKSLQALYDLIRKRTLASQMSNTKLELTTADITITQSSEICKAKGEVILFDGFLKVYQEQKDDDQDEDELNVLPSLVVGQKLKMILIESKQRYTKPEARYNEASLVKQMELLGIGRPSTYAPTIATILKRGYIEKKTIEGNIRTFQTISLHPRGKITMSKEEERFGVEKNRLFPTDLGTLVNDFLEQHFEKIMDYKFTAKIEKDFDKIAEGEEKWTEVLKHFFTDFEQNVKQVIKTAERVSAERELGKDPQTGLVVKARMGRYGPMVQLGENKEKEEEPKVRFAKLLPHQQINSITLEEALDLLSLPKTIAIHDETPLVLKFGPFGPYLHFNQKFYSIPKEIKNIFKIDKHEALRIIQEKDERDSNRLVKDFPEENIQILNGRFGVYIKAKEGNFKIPKALQDKASELTLEQVKEFIAHPAMPQKGRFLRKK